MAEDRISELEGMTMHSPKTEKPKEKNTGGGREGISEDGGHPQYV